MLLACDVTAFVDELGGLLKIGLNSVRARTCAWSVVIPTLWRSARIHALLADLDACGCVFEILLVDNAPDRAPTLAPLRKVRRISKGSNIYVNPAWNWGVEEARGEFIALCNDDINFSSTIFGEVEAALPAGAVVGMSAENFYEIPRRRGLKPGHCIGCGWGCLLMFRKVDYRPIPSELKIWCGDDWLVHSFGRVYSFSLPVNSEMSSSSSIPALNLLAVADRQRILQMLTSRDLRRIKILRSDCFGRYNYWTILRYFYRFGLKPFVLRLVGSVS